MHCRPSMQKSFPQYSITVGKEAGTGTGRNRVAQGEMNQPRYFQNVQIMIYLDTNRENNLSISAAQALNGGSGPATGGRRGRVPSPLTSTSEEKTNVSMRRFSMLWPRVWVLSIL